jgi:hypothetical protein
MPTLKKSITKNDILNAVRQLAKKLRRNPSLRDLESHGISRNEVAKRCGNLARALASVGLKPTGVGFPQTDAALLLDWAALARKVGKIPTSREYDRLGTFSSVPFPSRFRHWRNVPQAFSKFAHENRLDPDWQDVLELIAQHESEQDQPARGGRFRRSRKPSVLDGRPIYGPPMLLPEMAHAPVNEAGVIFAFGVLAQRLGFSVHRMQSEFPDCEAVREVARGQWQRVRVEFEFESRNFLKHKHDPNSCDVIVCWFHNWPECPVNIDVVELSKVASNGFAAVSRRAAQISQVSRE